MDKAAVAAKPAVKAEPGAPPTPLRPPLFRVTTPSREDRYLKALIYGDYGTGKTTLAASAEDVPAMNDVLFVDAESGDLSIRHRTDLSRVPVSDYVTFSHLFNYLREHCAARDRKDADMLAAVDAKYHGAALGKQFRTVIVDSLTEIQKYCMADILGINPKRVDLAADVEQAQFAQWGQNSSKIEKAVRYFRDLPMNVIFICPEKRTENDRKQLVREPNLPGKLATNVQGFLDVVGYLAVAQGAEKETIRRLFLQPSPVFQAKNRFAETSVPHLDNPTMTDIYQLIAGPKAATRKAS